MTTGGLTGIFKTLFKLGAAWNHEWDLSEYNKQ